MKPLYLLAHALLLTHALCAQTTAEKLSAFMDAANTAKLFNGVVLVTRNDSILLAKGYGWRDYENRIQHDTNSIFRIASVTKPFTAVAILYLKEQGKLILSDYVTKYFPEYSVGDKVTIKDLLTHTSGIFEYSNQENFFEEIAYKPYTQKDFWKYIKDKALQFTPGTEHQYSNSNYFILGYLIEKITGKPYEQNVREIIFNKVTKYKIIGVAILVFCTGCKLQRFVLYIFPEVFLRVWFVCNFLKEVFLVAIFKNTRGMCKQIF
ncbi:MAG TPA: serine hydrolase domain-containing protein, partial [Niastella sp.]